MFGTIVITFIITALGISVLFLIDRCNRKDNDNRRLSRTNDDLQRRIAHYQSRDQETREQSAYSRGLFNGRETDTLYRGLLSKCEKGEQATVIMRGISEYS